MGKYWLTSLPDVLHNAGLSVSTYNGWEARARSTGGYDGVFAVQVHHTASSSSPDGDMSYMWEGSPDRPVGAIYLARDGHLTVGAAGATNTSGKGGPRQTAHGTIPLDSANKFVISIEAANNGVGEQWPEAQVDAYVRAVAALNAAYGLSVGDAHAHFEWTDRKIDPAGNSRYATGGNKWNMDAFRGDVFLASQPAPTPPPLGDDDVIINLITHGSEIGVFAQYSGGYKIWVPDGNVLNVLLFCHPTIKGVTAFDSNWFVAAGPVLPGTALPYPCDSWGRKT
jgi:hypothetical protein